MTAKGWMVSIVLLQLIILLLLPIFLWANPEAVGRWRARACVAEEMVFGRYLYEGALAPPEEAESMARNTAYNVCSLLMEERRKSRSSIYEEK